MWERVPKEGAFWQSPEGKRRWSVAGRGEGEGQRKGTGRHGMMFSVVDGEVQVREELGQLVPGAFCAS